MGRGCEWVTRRQLALQCHINCRLPSLRWSPWPRADTAPQNMQEDSAGQESYPPNTADIAWLRWETATISSSIHQYSRYYSELLNSAGCCVVKTPRRLNSPHDIVMVMSDAAKWVTWLGLWFFLHNMLNSNIPVSNCEIVRNWYIRIKHVLKKDGTLEWNMLWRKMVH